LLEAVVLFYRVLIEARCRFPFEMCGLVIGDEWLSFYIKPADGYELPKIMQWMMNISSLSRLSRAGSMFAQGGKVTLGAIGTGRRFSWGSRRRGRKRWIGDRR
jgi:hypothetical protein